MTEATPAPSPTPAPGPTTGVSDLLGGQMSPEMARDKIEARKNDPAFRTKLLANDQAARQEWDRIHKIAFPAPPAIRSIEDVNNRAAARNALQWNEYVGWLKQRFPVSAEQEQELLRGVIRKDLHDWAKEEKDRIIKEEGFLQRLRKGDRAANREWGLVTAMLTLRPVE